MKVKQKIQSVQLMGVTNQIVDTKLHAFMNWQENIQANVYSFYVTYTNGSHKTIQTYKEDEVSYYMSYIKDKGNDTDSLALQDNIIDQLEKIKRLFDQNVIDETTYNKQRIALVSRLNSSMEKTDETNVYIVRDKPQKSGEAKMILYIDGEKDTEVVNHVDLHLNEGTYTIWFQRMALSSNKLMICIKRNVKYNISIKVGMFSINASISEQRDVPMYEI